MTIAIIILSVETTVSNGFNVPSFTPYLATAAILVVLNNITMTCAYWFASADRICCLCRPALIVYRLWKVSHEVRPHMLVGRYLRLVIRIVIESASLYTLTAILFLVTTAAKSNVDYIIGAAV